MARSYSSLKQKGWMLSFELGGAGGELVDPFLHRGAPHQIPELVECERSTPEHPFLLIKFDLVVLKQLNPRLF